MISYRGSKCDRQANGIEVTRLFVAKKSTVSEIKDTWQSFIDVAMRCCLVLIIGFAFANQQVFALSVAQKSRLDFQSEISPSHQELSPAGTRINYPADADSNEPEAFECDECQDSEEKDEEFTQSPFAFSAEIRIVRSSARLNLLIDLLESEKRSETSLYILYHSWKSFLY